MTKSNITQYDNTAANNTDVEDVPLGENQMYPSNVNNAFREIMADLADINDGTVAMTSPSATSLSVTNNITVGGTVDGRDVATDGTKLDGIEAGATNVSSLTDLSITDGTDGQVLTTDGAGTFTFEDAAGGSSNADTLDNLDSTQFLRSDTADTMTGQLNVENHIEMASGDSTASRFLKLPRGGGVTFYGDGSDHHAIMSRDASGNYADDILISSYGGVHIDLDSNNNNSSGANFTIGKHNSGSADFTINGESGLLTFSGGIDSNGGTLDHDGAVIIRNNGVSGQGDNNTHFNYQDTGVNYIRGTNTYVNARIEMSNVIDMNNNDIYGVDQIFHHDDTNTYMQFHASDHFRVVTGGTERLEVNGNGVHGNGVANKWLRFEQIGTHSASGSKGVSSLTDNGTGKTRVNYSGYFTSTSYCCPAAAADASSGVARRAMPADGGLIYTTYIQITVDNNGSTNNDAEYVHASFFHTTGTG